MSLALGRDVALFAPERATNGSLPPWMEQRSALLAYLPAIFGEGEESSFLARYLLIFQTIIDDLDRLLDGLPSNFAPDTAPEDFLPWLASWVGLLLDEGWPIARRRAVLARAMELHRWRGTIRGLTDHVELYSGVRPEIVERGSGLTLGRASRLGHQTVLGRGERLHHFSVILRVPNPEVLDRARLRVIVEAQRPAHTTYALFILEDENAPPPADSGPTTVVEPTHDLDDEDEGAIER